MLPQPPETEVAWRSALHLASMVNQGKPVPPIPPTIFLRAGEFQFGAVQLNCAMHYGMDVEYSTHYVWGGGLIGTAVGLGVSAASNAAARNAAERQAMPQWRPMGGVLVVPTNRRMVVQLQNNWTSFELGGLLSLHLDVPTWSLHLGFDGGDPMMLSGPWAPWLAVVISATVSGRPWPPGTVLPPPVAQPSPVIQGQVVPPQRPALPPGRSE